MTQARPVHDHGDVRSGIVEAAARLLRTEGAHAVTTRAVARQAGVQPPTIYRLFGDKDGLIDAVAEHVMAAYVSEKTDAAARPDTDPVAELHEAWRAHVAFGVANAELYVLLTPPAAAPARLQPLRVSRCCGPGCDASRQQGCCASTNNAPST